MPSDLAVLALEWRDGVAAHRVALAPGRTLALGRDAACDVCFDNLAVSRRHAEIVVDPGGMATLRPRSRTSPTWLNGALAVRDAPLAAGDVLRLGIVELRVVTAG